MSSTMRFAFLKGMVLILFLCSLLPKAYAQTTIVEGFIQEENTGEPIIFAHIFFKGTAVGTRSDTTGHFKISIGDNEKKVDSLVVTYLAYHTQTIAIKPGVQQKLTIKMRPQFTQLQEITVSYDNNPAFPILDKVVKQKERNNPDGRNSFYCEEYAKIRFDLNHLTEKLKKISFFVRLIGFGKMQTQRQMEYHFFLCYLSKSKSITSIRNHLPKSVILLKR